MRGVHPAPAAAPSPVRDVLIVLACLCVVVASLKAAATFFVPVVVALILSLACIPAVRRLERIGLPSAVAIPLVLLFVVAAALVVPLVVGTALSGFQEALPEYRAKAGPFFTDLANWLREFGWNVPEPRLAEWFSTDSLFQLVTDTARGLVKVLSNVVVVLLVMIFTLVEARLLPHKLERAFGKPDAAGALEQITQRTGRYISVKAAMSLLTGALIGLLNAVVGVDFALLWGFVAFAFNFVPNIGSVLASIPALLLAALEFGLGPTALLGAGYLVINLGISNGLEPQVMGTRLGLSTLVVFLSLLFWFFVWGPVGMLLSAPLTMIVKIVLDQNEESRPYARLLERYQPERSRAGTR
jgi:predicted PurR-regulated permease PerM